MQESVMIFTTFIYKSTNLQFFKPVQEQRLFKKKKKMQEHDQENREKKETNTFGLVVIFESLFPKTARLTDHHVFSLSLFLFFSYFHAIIVKECSKEENVSFYNSLSLSVLRLTRRRVSVFASLLWLPLSSSWEKMDLLCLMELIMAL